jgi:hypothetical protein
MEAASTSEMLVNFYLNTQHNIPEDSLLIMLTGLKLIEVDWLFRIVNTPNLFCGLLPYDAM